MLPGSDMDIKILSQDLPDTEDMHGEIGREEVGAILDGLQALFSGFPTEMKIRDLNVVKGRISLLTFFVDELKIDITVNKASDILKTLFIQQSIAALDMAFGVPITKKSILLGKLLCTNFSIMGSKAGRLPSYAIELAIIFVLNTIPLINTTQVSITNIIVNLLTTFMTLTAQDILTICGKVNPKKVNESIINKKRLDSLSETECRISSAQI